MMRWTIVILQLGVASASAFNVVSFRLDNLLAEGASELDRLALAALAAIALLTLAVVVVSRRATSLATSRTGFSIALIGLTALSGFVPRTVYSSARAEAQAVREREQLQQRQAAARELHGWSEDIDRRAAETRSFDPEQAYEFLDVLSGAGYWDDGANPLSLQALDLLRKALALQLIDVNASVRGHRHNDVTARPLFLQFYKERVEPFRHTLPRQDWEIMRLLVSGGADLAPGDAAPLVADLAKTAEPPAPSRFVTLK